MLDFKISFQKVLKLKKIHGVEEGNSSSFSLSLSLATLSLSDDCWATAALGQVLRLSLVSSPVTSTHQVLPPLLFPSLMLCEAEHRNPNLKLFSYLTSLLTLKFLKKKYWVYMCTPMSLYWIRPRSRPLLSLMASTTPWWPPALVQQLFPPMVSNPPRVYRCVFFSSTFGCLFCRSLGFHLPLS